MIWALLWKVPLIIAVAVVEIMVAAVFLGLLLNITFANIISEEEPDQCISVEKKLKNVRTRL